MEAFLTNVSRNCPFLRRTPVSALRQMSTMPANHQKKNTGKPTTALVAAAHKCPIMSKAIEFKAASEAARTFSSTSAAQCPYAQAAASRDKAQATPAQPSRFYRHQQSEMQFAAVPPAVPASAKGKLKNESSGTPIGF